MPSHDPESTELSGPESANVAPSEPESAEVTASGLESTVTSIPTSIPASASEDTEVSLLSVFPSGAAKPSLEPSGEASTELSSPASGANSWSSIPRMEPHPTRTKPPASAHRAGEGALTDTSSPLAGRGLRVHGHFFHGELAGLPWKSSARPARALGIGMNESRFVSAATIPLVLLLAGCASVLGIEDHELVDATAAEGGGDSMTADGPGDAAPYQDSGRESGSTSGPEGGLDAGPTGGDSGGPTGEAGGSDAGRTGADAGGADAGADARADAGLSAEGGTEGGAPDAGRCVPGSVRCFGGSCAGSACSNPQRQTCDDAGTWSIVQSCNYCPPNGLCANECVDQTNQANILCGLCRCPSLPSCAQINSNACFCYDTQGNNTATHGCSMCTASCSCTGCGP
jgi:hypothetical protein